MLCALWASKQLTSPHSGSFSLKIISKTWKFFKFAKAERANLKCHFEWHSELFSGAPNEIRVSHLMKDLQYHI